jgi:AraC-like DNA-binding protein
MSCRTATRGRRWCFQPPACAASVPSSTATSCRLRAPSGSRPASSTPSPWLNAPSFARCICWNRCRAKARQRWPAMPEEIGRAAACLRCRRCCGNWCCSSPLRRTWQPTSRARCTWPCWWPTNWRVPARCRWVSSCQSTSACARCARRSSTIRCATRSLGGWASEAGASVRTVARLFRSELGHQFRRLAPAGAAGARLSMAAQRRPMAHIAAELGYASASAFSAMVRRSVGVPPTRLLAGRPPRLRPR